jgi:cytochrome c2
MQLFHDGPNQFIAGSKMPEQRITNRADLEALVGFIEKNSQ